MSDVFGSMVKQRLAEQTAAQADWLIGEGLLATGINGVALRSMKAPGTAYDDAKLGGKDPQPATMADYVDTDDDDGGVHINSGIPNRAFYLAATAFGGSSWEQAGKIWYATLADPALKSTATFAQFATRTSAQAKALFGADVQKTVKAAWKERRHHGSLSRRPVPAAVASPAWSPPASTPQRHHWFATNLPAAVAPLSFDRVAGGHSCLTYVVTDASGASASCCAARRSATCWRRRTTSPASTTSWAAWPTRRCPCRGCSGCATTRRSTRRRST